MFWPPQWTPNNQVWIDDAAWVLATGLPQRFLPFSQSTTVLSPWMSWNTTDLPWHPSDPIARFLLIGDPPAQLYSLNSNTHGSVIALGAPPLGLQRWEVVSFFDWYTTAGGAAKIGSMAWARPFVGAAPPPPPIVVEWGQPIITPLSASDWSIDIGLSLANGIVVFIACVDSDTALPGAANIGGVPITIVRYASPGSGQSLLLMWAYVTGSISSTLTLTFSAPCSGIVFGWMVTGVAAVGIQNGAFGSGAASVVGGGPTIITNTIALSGTCFSDNGAPFDLPTVDEDGVSGPFGPGPFVWSAFGHRINSVSYIPSASNSGSASAHWTSGIVTLNAH